MPTYTAPVEDMMFLFEKLRNNKEYNELEKYKEVTPDLVKDILQEAAKINQNLILPLAKVGDENPAGSHLPTLKLPKSKELPVDANVTASMVSETLGVYPPQNNARV